MRWIIADERVNLGPASPGRRALDFPNRDKEAAQLPFRAG
jgi:hypothetical protein